MAEKTVPASIVLHVGETAGAVWGTLSQKGPLTFAKLVQAVGEPRDTVMQAIGWLAREDKIDISERKRVQVVSLK
ncbi:MAG: winged helix-turn-helix domain-containing protein [Thermoguttaceae bacterium]|jgi:hypothetical protein